MAQVRPSLVGLAGGALAGLVLLALGLHLFGAADAVAREGGLHLVWSPPPGYDAARLRSRPVGRRARLVVRDGTVELDVAGVAPADVVAAAAQLAAGPVAVYEVRETAEMTQLPRVLALKLDGADRPVGLAVDAWTASGGLQHADVYLRGERAAIAAQLALAAAAGWRLPPGTHVAYGRDGSATRTYVLADSPELTGDDIADAELGADGDVIAELAPDAAARFAALTTRLAGHKLAIVRGEDVLAAPLVTAAAREGRLVLAAGDGLRLSTLRGGPLPVGGEVRAVTYLPPSAPVVAWLARLALALGGGVACGALVRAWAARRAA